jgi:MtrB/PioB family decaheme-associated outer membrane protein
MTTHKEKIKANVLNLAVQSALVVMFTLPTAIYAADAVDSDTTALTHPTNTIEIGGEYVSDNSAKFGQYNGLDENGAYGIANIHLRGGNGYDGGDEVTRWDINGTDLGTTSRSLGGTVSNQGKWSIGIKYDELRHNLTDGYQTPQLGSMGGNTFTMPTNFGSINADSGSGAARPTQPSARSLNTTQLGDFHTENVHTDRKNSSLNAEYSFSPQLSVQFDYNHLDQSGAKLIGTGAQGGISLTGGSTGRAEANNILMNPTNYKTDTFNLAVNWNGEKGHLTAGYYGSFFHDEYNSLSWQNALATGNPASSCVGANCFTHESMSTAPDNSLNQFNLTGGYAFSPSTKLAGGLSYGRNTQNDSYSPTSIMQASGTAFNMMQTNGLPQSSLDGVVITTHADLKLTNQTTKDLALSAAFKYNERDNQTDSKTYLYKDLGNVSYTGVNLPYSNRKTQYELAADYRLTKGQNLRVAYERENIKRWCDSVIGGAQCISSPSSDENKLGINYRLKARENVNLNAGYSYAKRNADFSGFSANTGIYPVINAGDVLGFVAYPYATRTQNLLKAGVTWQVTEKFDLGLNGRYSYDNYDATLGVQDGRSKGINIDATYSYNQDSSISAYFSWQNQERNMRNAGNGTVTTAPTQIWTNQLESSSNAVGLNTKHSGLMRGKLEVLGDISYSLDKSGYSTQAAYTSGATLCSLPWVLTCGSTPDIRTQLITVKLIGNYQVNKPGKVALGYVYQHLNSDDYFYNSYQYGYTPNRVMPTNQQSGSYSVNELSATYIYSF